MSQTSRRELRRVSGSAACRADGGLETARIERIRRRLAAAIPESHTAASTASLGAAASPQAALADAMARLELGPGDDAAVVRSPAGRLVLSVDAQREGVHFERSWLTPQQLGRRALAVACSDLGAMGAVPRWALCTVQAPRDTPNEWFDGVADGMADAQVELGVAVIGGDLGRGAERGLTVTAIGVIQHTDDSRAVDAAAARPGEPVRRDGAVEGMELWVTGYPGRAAAGRELLAMETTPDDESAASVCVAAFVRPCPPIQLGAEAGAAGLVAAMLDVSDGLATDLERMCRASGVAAVLQREALADPVLLAAAHLIGAVDRADRTDTADTADPVDWGDAPSQPAAVADLVLQWVLHGGDDYELLCAVHAGRSEAFAGLAARHGVAARRIGSICAPKSQPVGEDEATAITIVAEGERHELAPRGFDHFADSAGSGACGTGSAPPDELANPKASPGR